MLLSNIYYLYEIGGKRNQEDYIWPTAGSATLQDRIFIVCDGVGGSENGEIASKIIAESMGNALKRIPPEKIKSATVNEELETSRQKLVSYANSHRLNPDMATTICILVLTENKAFISWSGDSRVYHLRNGEVLYKTSDHSLVNTLVKKGEISEEDASSHPQKNIILKAIKADETPVEAEDQWIEDVRGGDYFLLCTDGLFENITEEDLSILLNKNDKGDFDLVNAFQKYCFNKTRDNYSMYLLRISPEKKPVSKPSNLIYLILILIIIISVFVLGIGYISNHKKLNGPHPVTGSTHDSVQPENAPKDSLPYVEIVNSPGNDSNNTNESSKKGMKDSLSKKP